MFSQVNLELFLAFQTLLVPPSPTFCHSCTVLLGSHNSVCTLVKELCPKANNFVYCYTSWVPDEIDSKMLDPSEPHFYAF